MLLIGCSCFVLKSFNVFDDDNDYDYNVEDDDVYYDVDDDDYDNDGKTSTLFSWIFCLSLFSILFYFLLCINSLFDRFKYKNDKIFAAYEQSIILENES